MRNDIFRKGLVFGITLLFVTASIVSALNANPSSNSTSAKLGNWLYVGGSGPGNYTKIQDAINDSSDGDTVFVYDDSSPYNEAITIYTSIRLLGEDKNTTIINFNPSYPINQISIISINASYCSIENLQITLSNKSIIAQGITINSTNNKIKNTIITNVEDGIKLFFNTQSNLIINNEIKNNLIGLVTFESTNNKIYSNIFLNNSIYNIYLSTYSDLNNISFNTIKNSSYGIRIKDSSYNNVYKNCIENNGIGIYCCCGADLNFFYNNNFLNNSNHAQEDIVLINTWYDPLTNTGNYWDDYTGVDANGDDIGDTPYKVSYGQNQDLYPSMKSYSCTNHPPETPIITGRSTGQPGTPYEYHIVDLDIDGDYNLLYYDIDWGDETTDWLGPYASGEEVKVIHAWFEKGTYEVKVKAYDSFVAESDWATLTVTMPYSYDKPLLQIFQMLFQRFPNAFPILRQLMGY
jgi:nitrous oxidase accessory protein